MSKLSQHIDAAIRCLTNDGLVGIPTETVYGLAANGLKENCIIKIFEAKKRPFFDPLILHVGSKQDAYTYVLEFNDKASLLADAFWPGPLTLLLPKQKTVPDLITSGLSTVAIRVPNHPLTLELLNQLDFPLAAPSANPFGYISPTTAQHVIDQLGEEVCCVLDGGSCSVGLESTIVGFENEQPVIYRLGGLSIEAIEEVVGKCEVALNQSSNPKAPGQLKSHYAPRKPMFMGNVVELAKQHTGKKIGLLSFQETHNLSNSIQVVLSKPGDLKEAASGLFAAMRSLDTSDCDIIIAEEFPDSFLGKAINDRLRRACA